MITKNLYNEKENFDSLNPESSHIKLLPSMPFNRVLSSKDVWIKEIKNPERQRLSGS